MGVEGGGWRDWPWRGSGFMCGKARAGVAASGISFVWDVSRTKGMRDVPSDDIACGMWLDA